MYLLTLQHFVRCNSKITILLPFITNTLGFKIIFCKILLPANWPVELAVCKKKCDYVTYSTWFTIIMSLVFLQYLQSSGRLQPVPVSAGPVRKHLPSVPLCRPHAQNGFKKSRQDHCKSKCLISGFFFLKINLIKSLRFTSLSEYIHVHCTIFIVEII